MTENFFSSSNYSSFESAEVLFQIYFQNFTDDLDVVNLPVTTTTQSTTTKEPSKETEVSILPAY